MDAAGLSDGVALATEAVVFGRYLVGRTPPPELIERYADANRTLFTGVVADPRETAVLAFLRRHPWSVGFADAVCGLRHPGGLVRGKILVMAAILETSPAFADEFLPRSAHPLALVMRLGAAGALATLRAVAGLALYGLMTRTAAT
jgi:hypothetical protein